MSPSLLRISRTVIMSVSALTGKTPPVKMIADNKGGEKGR